MSKPAISVQGVHRFFGPLHAVRDVSFEIEAGCVVGFIGANGAGKTTTMRMMATLDLPDRGQISVAGIDVVNYPLQVRQRIGWMPDAYGAYPNMTIEEYLDFFARAFGYKSSERRERIEEVMAFTELTNIRDRNVDKLSKGMGQRLCLGRTLIHDPEVLILDEPAAGLDPKARVELKHLIRLLAEEGKTILISSHILSELGEMCDSLVFIDQGAIVHQGSMESLTRGDETGIAVAIDIAEDQARLEAWLSMQPEVALKESRKSGCLLHFETDDTAVLTETMKRMLNAGFPVTGFRREEIKLEDAFVALLRRLDIQANGTQSPPPLPTFPDNTPSDQVTV